MAVTLDNAPIPLSENFENQWLNDKTRFLHLFPTHQWATLKFYYKALVVVKVSVAKIERLPIF